VNNMSWKNIITKKKGDRRARASARKDDMKSPTKLVGASDDEINQHRNRKHIKGNATFEADIDEFDDSRESKEIATIRNKLNADAVKQVKEDSAKILAAELKRVTDLISGTSARKLIKLSAKGEVTLDML
tara:strand:+ start:162 stop:551 length:390 start_codon:yes stop_codon:yes gene_type:complete